MRILAATALLGSLVGGSASALPPPLPAVAGRTIRCVAIHEGLPSCGYQATGPGQLVALHQGDWTVKILRLGNTVWTYGGQTFDQRDIPSLPGDTVQIRILRQPCPAQPEACIAAGPIVAYEESAE